MAETPLHVAHAAVAKLLECSTALDEVPPSCRVERIEFTLNEQTGIVWTIRTSTIVASPNARFEAKDGRSDAQVRDYRRQMLAEAFRDTFDITYTPALVETTA